MNKIIIRAAKIEDLKVLLEFEQGVIDAEKPLDPYLREEKITYYNIKEFITSENSQLLVAVSDLEIVGSGYIRIEDSKHYQKNAIHGYIGFMFVKPSFRGQKISAQILSALKDWGKEKDLKELRLDVYSNNPSAIKLYSRFGFNKSLVNMRMEI